MGQKILITGGTGLIGQTLAKVLHEEGNEINILSRSSHKHPHYTFYKWNPRENYIEEGALDVDYIIHLAGAGIAEKRWTADRKKAIIKSRVETTQCLKSALEKSGNRPGYIGASAIGIYGNYDAHALSEEEIPASAKGFLCDVVDKWENAHQELKGYVSSLAILRIGIVLSTQGGALKPMLIPFRFRMGNYFGDGTQMFSWIHLHDLCRIFSHLMSSQLSGTYNGVAPNPVNGKALVRAIAHEKKGPFIRFGIPSFVLRMIFGGMSEAILMSTFASSTKIENQGFTFRFPKIQAAIKHLLKEKV